LVISQARGYEYLRSHGETGIHRLLASGGGVILGRAAAVVLGKDHGFHVRLDGHLCDPADPSLYHLVIDSTVIPLDAVTELITIAARALPPGAPGGSGT
jgi:hypothetical protein